MANRIQTKLEETIRAQTLSPPHTIVCTRLQLALLVEEQPSFSCWTPFSQKRRICSRCLDSLSANAWWILFLFRWQFESEEVGIVTSTTDILWTEMLSLTICHSGALNRQRTPSRNSQPRSWASKRGRLLFSSFSRLMALTARTN